MKVNSGNINDLYLEADRAIGSGEHFFQICRDTDPGAQLPFSRLSEAFEQLLKLENDIQLSYVDIPYCVLGGVDERLVSNEPSEDKSQIAVCRGCRYEFRCAGPQKAYVGRYGEKEFRAMVDLPREVMIEVEARCNLECGFCFNRNSFARDGRKGMNMSSGKVKRVIKAIADAGVGIVRFTGGEPLMREDIFELMEYARTQGLKIRLNTNATLIDKNAARKLRELISSVLVPIEGANNEDDARVSGRPHSLKRKLEAVDILRHETEIVVRAGTVATKRNIDRLDDIRRLIRKKDIIDWEIYRPIPTPLDPSPMDSVMAAGLMNKLLDFREREKEIYRIVNGIPFCVIEKKKAALVSRGALPVDGNVRYAIDPRGWAKPDYYMDKKIGDAEDVLGSWRHEFMKKMRRLEFLPAPCRDCGQKWICRGGSRFSAFAQTDDYSSPDPLMPKD